MDPRSITTGMTLGEIVTRQPSLAIELERRGLDYCCHGGRTLEAAANEADLDARALAAELSSLGTDEPAASWAGLGPAELVDHIESVHHQYLWSSMPRIRALVDKIVSVHGERHPELSEVQWLVEELWTDLEPHLVREEHDLFPMVRLLTAGTPRSQIDTAELVEEIAALSGEHETVGGLLEELRRVTDGYTPPADGCATYTACYDALAELEADTHLHVHKENNVLFASVLASAVAPART